MNRTNRTIIAMTLIVVSLGCGGTRSQSQQDLDEAQNAVKVALTAWKNKETRKALESTKSIQASDPDWTVGLRLLDFEIQKTEGVEGKSARSSVVLSLKDRKDRKIERSVIYEVTTMGDKKIVARDPFY